MQARGVARAIVAHTTAIFHDSAAGNRAVESLAGQHQTLVPAAVVNPRHFPACVVEASRARQAGVVCFRLFPNLHGYQFDSDLPALRETLNALSGARLIQIDTEGGRMPLLTAALNDLLPAPALLTVD